MNKSDAFLNIKKHSKERKKRRFLCERKAFKEAEKAFIFVHIKGTLMRKVAAIILALQLEVSNRNFSM